MARLHKQHVLQKSCTKMIGNSALEVGHTPQQIEEGEPSPGRHKVGSAQRLAPAKNAVDVCAGPVVWNVEPPAGLCKGEKRRQNTIKYADDVSAL